MEAANAVCLAVGAALGWYLYQASAGQPEGARWLLAAEWALIAFIVTRTAWAAREGIAHFVRGLLLASGLGALAYVAALGGGIQDQAGFVGTLAGAVAVWLAPRRRRRRVSAATKRRLIARDLRGERYDPSRRHIDHIHPFSRGGSDTEDNLRVVDKRKNIRKGASKPGFWDWFLR